MSLLGIDVGTSAVKIGAYNNDGTNLSVCRVPVTLLKKKPGWQELDPEVVWSATCEGLRRINESPGVRKDPPTALAISASGDEVFPVQEDGRAVAPCILSGDTRGSFITESTLQSNSSVDWYDTCGHVPGNMDPVHRIELYKEFYPDSIQKAMYFLGWHEFLTMKLTGIPVTDPTLASKWLIYDLKKGNWSQEWLQKFEIKVESLPQVMSWGQQIGEVKSSLAKELGLPSKVIVAVGNYDATCCALGSGVIDFGQLGLACGSWQAVVAPAKHSGVPHPSIIGKMPIVPYIEPGYALLAQSPNGSSVLNWAATITGLSYDTIAKELFKLIPSPVIGLPHLSGGSDLWKEGPLLRGGIFGATLATSKADIVQAMLEGVAYELAVTIELLQQAGIKTECMRASGGGTKLGWWMQLKADLSGIPIEVSDQLEPGTLGAALLAGTAIDVYDSISEAVSQVQSFTKYYEPDLHRAKLHKERLELYRDTVQSLYPTHRRLYHHDE
jgi:xylulokinase